MGLCVQILLGILVISNSFVWACDPTECRHLRERLETLENVVQRLISVVASQKTGEELDGILELTGALDSSTNKTVPIVETGAKQNKNEVNRLKGALKCSLEKLLDINHSDNNKKNPSGKIAATLGANNSLQIEWTPLSMDCVKFSSGVWIRVYESGQSQSADDNYLAVPQKCLKRRGNASLSIALPSSASKLSGNSCHFDLNEVLIQCRVYTVEVVPNYQSLKGTPLSTEIVIPPSNDNSTDSRESLISVSSNSSFLSLEWKDNSGCANRLTALHFKIFPDGEGNAENATMSLRIPRDCLKQPTEEIDLFSLSLSQFETCPVNWVPLDPCRSYKIEMKSEYSDTWTRAATLWETFTEIQEIPQTKCPRDEFLYDGNCYSNSYICNGNYEFGDYYYTRAIDEQYCDSDCHNGFRCGRQCVPTDLLCDGVEDCIDGSDESDSSCDPFARNESCQQVTNYSGQITSHRKWVKTPKNVVLVTVQENYTIWLNFNGYVNQENHLLKVYDGPYLTSPLLLSHNGTKKPNPIRSSSNNLYVEFPSHPINFKVLLVYTSVEKEPSIPGCGGYVYGEGLVSSPTNFSDNGTECVWYVETEHNDTGIFLKRDSSSNVTANEHPMMMVYDGWDTTGQLLYDASNLQTSEILYSISNKMRIRFMRLPVTSNRTTDWNVKTISLHHKNIVGSTGIIESPNYPTVYANLVDYRWNIVTELGKKVQLLFAIFNTQEKFDFVYVYDGPTVNSPLLLQKSGWQSTPFTITSSSNEMLVRFTSDDAITLPGFLVVYSTV